jgi:hypothetical protein
MKYFHPPIPPNQIQLLRNFLMKPRTAIVLAALLAIALWANALNQAAAPAPKTDKATACCVKGSAKSCCKDGCKDGKWDTKACSKDGAECQDCCANMAKGDKGCCEGKDGKSCPMMSKASKGKGCCGGASCSMHGHAAAK